MWDQSLRAILALKADLVMLEYCKSLVGPSHHVVDIYHRVLIHGMGHSSSRALAKAEQAQVTGQHDFVMRDSLSKETFRTSVQALNGRGRFILQLHLADSKSNCWPKRLALRAPDLLGSSKKNSIFARLLQPSTQQSIENRVY